MEKQKSNEKWLSGDAHEDIVTIGAKTLRVKSQMIEEITHINNLQLYDKLVFLLRELKGAGLASNQIGVNKRVIVVEVRQTDVFPNRPVSPLYVMINPVLIEESGEIVEDWEGCYSVPGIMGMVPRYEKIKMQYFDANGKKIVETYSGYLARVIMHEYDHLDGTIFLDRMRSMESITTVKNYMKNYHGK